MVINLSPEDATILNNVEITLKSMSLSKDIIPYSIFYEGRPIRTYSGKSVWKSKGDAKRALTNLFDRYYGGNVLKSSSAITNFLLEHNIVEIKPINYAEK